MSRLEDSVVARGVLGEDFYGGWTEADIELFQRFARPAEAMVGKITDFMGIRTTTAFHPWAPHYDNQVLSALPIPDDALRAEAIEYFALFHALENARDKRFAMAEIGASYAPWTCAAAVNAQRMGMTDISLTAVEASSFLFSLIPQHLAENAVDTANIRLINGAAGTHRTTMYFPKVSNPGDNGGQASATDIESDYLNRAVDHEPVDAFPLDEILPEGLVDLIHVDVQGFEVDILEAGFNTLNQRVRAAFIGTHSRKIEGLLLDMFHSAGWELVRERPVRFTYEKNRSNIVGWTTRDGGQYWLNPLLQ